MKRPYFLPDLSNHDRKLPPPLPIHEIAKRYLARMIAKSQAVPRPSALVGR